jgi:hypothetical protein
MGGLGNQLFQIFTLIAYGLREKVKFVFPFSDTLTTGVNRPTYWGSFLSRLRVFTAGTEKNNPINDEVYSWNKIREPNFQYNELPSITQDQNIMLIGYWQSYKYFDTVKDTIFRMIQLDKQKELIIRENIEYFGNTEKAEDFIKYISMHFRLGDYKNLPDCHPILSREYYANSLKIILDSSIRINNQYKVLYFCEAEDNSTVSETIDYLKDIFKDINIVFIKVDDTIPDWKQLLMMSCCNYNIIANSSFSWWAAYMNSNLNKIVCYPDKWFGPKIMNNNPSELYCRDMYLPEWIRIQTAIK